MQNSSPPRLIHNRYQIVRPLGAGAMSSVFLVSDRERPGALWALKELKLSSNSDDKQMELALFKREGDILARLHHPGLPRLVDFYSDGQENYLVMECVQGDTLDRLISGRVQPLRPEEAIPIALQAAHVIAYLHDQDPPVIFRDLKPSNIMLTDSGRVCFIDFGIARFFNPQQKKDTQELGTPGFCAPEQYHGHSNLTSDIYSLGVTLFYLLSLKDPQSFNFVFPLLSELNPDAPAELDAVLSKCLELEPSKRYQDAPELIRELDDILCQMDHTPNASTRSLHPALLSLSHHYRRVVHAPAQQRWKSWWQWIKAMFSKVPRK